MTVRDRVWRRSFFASLYMPHTSCMSCLNSLISMGVGAVPSSISAVLQTCHPFVPVRPVNERATVCISKPPRMTLLFIYDSHGGACCHMLSSAAQTCPKVTDIKHSWTRDDLLTPPEPPSIQRSHLALFVLPSVSCLGCSHIHVI